tara:strand:+ start:111 stop:977 length:867 start_codon:yes stop_codon:yes gene_type:complete
MAFYYYQDYNAKGSRNFGDDINPKLLTHLFSKNIIDSESVCVMGIGTILSDEHLNNVSDYKKKVIFSSGVGYGTLDKHFDDSWDFVCVRGPKTSAELGLPPEKGICDGAILLSQIYPVKAHQSSGPVVFIPHVESSWKSREGLEAACRNLGIEYLVPDQEFETFVKVVQSASLVITEAMHGAILADTMRIPWIPVAFHFHNEFKWKDWFASMELDYVSHSLTPLFWKRGEGLMPRFKRPYQMIKYKMFERSLNHVLLTQKPILSEESRLNKLQTLLRERVDYINNKYG